MLVQEPSFPHMLQVLADWPGSWVLLLLIIDLICSSSSWDSTFTFKSLVTAIWFISISVCSEFCLASMLIWCSNQRESRFSRILENYFEISLLDLDLEAFSFHFSFSISISRPFHFTFHSRSRFQGILISLFILEISESISDFTLFLEKKEWKIPIFW